ncbi:MAG: sugar phosphate nucleotidyltransferase [Candidatus Staskawiczbacteria bacterium]|nr:sugar phosphate nucleotidyltransferase [Candidatus Staskawiczbacteria bacterium]
MKAVILAGGNGTRLRPLTLATNKHLLGLYDKPVIYYAIEKLVSAGIYKIMLVTSPQHVGDFVKLLGSGHNFKMSNGKQVQITYGVQNEPNGIAYGLYIAKDYVGSDNCILYLGDNIIEDDITEHVQNFRTGAKIFLKSVADPRCFGVATLDANNKVIGVEEKPENPKSNLAVTGLYFYDNTVFDKIVNQPQSDRGEYEITYINKYNASVYMHNKHEKNKK